MTICSININNKRENNPGGKPEVEKPSVTAWLFSGHRSINARTTIGCVDSRRVRDKKSMLTRRRRNKKAACPSSRRAKNGSIFGSISPPRNGTRWRPQIIIISDLTYCPPFTCGEAEHVLQSSDFLLLKFKSGVSVKLQSSNNEFQEAMSREVHFKTHNLLFKNFANNYNR